MKSFSSKLLSCLALGALSLGIPVTQAAVIDAASLLVGSFNPASTLNNDTEVTTGANLLIDWKNGTISNPSNATTTFSLSSNSFGLLQDATFVAKDETGPTFDAFNAPAIDYVLGKYGNVAYLFYVGGLTENGLTLPATADFAGNQNGLSHQVTFSAPGGGGTTGVPDGGSTLALLGLGLAALGVARRYLS
jgi:hypothetical protein